MRAVALPLILALVFLRAAGAAPDAHSSLAREVRAIFTAKCVECHGPTLEHPRGKFGYVLDLARLAANPKLIQPGDPDNSELYLMLKHDEMPIAEAQAALLTAAEKDTVRRWIESGAPPVAKEETPPAKPPLTWARRIIRDIGQFHPLTTHFPIALLIVALPAELFWMRTRNPSWKLVVRFCVILGTAGSVVAASLGWCEAEFVHFTSNAAQVLEWHRWVGTGTAVWALITVVLSEKAARAGASRRMEIWFRCSLVVGMASVMMAGYLGGALIYGLNHYQW